MGAGGMEVARVVGDGIGGPAGPAHHLEADHHGPHEVPFIAAGQSGGRHGRRVHHHAGMAGGRVVDVVVLDGMARHRVGHGRGHRRGAATSTDHRQRGAVIVGEAAHGTPEHHRGVGDRPGRGHADVIEQQASHRVDLRLLQRVELDARDGFCEFSGSAHRFGSLPFVAPAPGSLLFVAPVTCRLGPVA